MNNRTSSLVSAFLLFCSLGLISGKAFASEEDPLEGFNRGMFAFNETFDKYLFKPVAKGYDAITPEPVDKGVSNVFDNLSETKNFINNLLQFKFKEAGVDLSRFVINSTVGVVGIFDVASGWGLEENQEDFGQTLGAWGVGKGPYLVLPFFGPSNFRDGFGLIPDAFSVPQYYIEDNDVQLGVYITDAIDTRSDLLKQEGLIQGDRYSFIRDAYLQRRDFLVNDGVVEDEFTSDDLDAEE